ncbi:MAG: hypothetical protein ACI8RD_010894 [Bacillariaceae sp.]|jgi:hypothetical protein
MASHNFIKAAAAGALALNGGGISDGGVGETNTCNAVGPLALNEGGVNDTCQQQRVLPQCPRQLNRPVYHQTVRESKKLLERSDQFCFSPQCCYCIRF